MALDREVLCVFFTVSHHSFPCYTVRLFVASKGVKDLLYCANVLLLVSYGDVLLYRTCMLSVAIIHPLSAVSLGLSGSPLSWTGQVCVSYSM